jgi:hypothetical protein
MGIIGFLRSVFFPIRDDPRLIGSWLVLRVTGDSDFGGADRLEFRPGGEMIMTRPSDSADTHVRCRYQIRGNLLVLESWKRVGYLFEQNDILRIDQIDSSIWYQRQL